jgi:hypothetical protein
VTSAVVAGLVVVALSSPSSAVTALKLAAPIVGTVVGPRGGYWEVGADGGVFSFGGAKFYGSLPGEKIRTRKIVGICPTRDGKGYWLLSSTGKVYTFGDARDLGNGNPGARAIIPDGAGYRVIYSDGASAAFLEVLPASTTPSSNNAASSSGASDLVPPASLMPDSIFNQPVTGWSVASDSSTLVSNFVAGYKANYGNVGVSTQPMYWVPTSQPDVSFSQTPSADGCSAGPFVGTTPGYVPTEVPIPSFAGLNGSSDNPLDVYNANNFYEIWQANEINSSSWEGCYGGAGAMSSFTGVFANNRGRSATSISEVATMVTEADVASGSINHALSINITDCNGWVLPATRGDCGSDPGQPAEGQWFRFAPGTTCNPTTQCTTPFAHMVFNAISTYGMVVMDQSGAYQINAEQPSDWAAEGESGTDPMTASWDGQQEYSVIANLPWGDLQVLNYT